MGPLQGLGSRLACGGGCGEIYVGEYINHPPLVDPCGSCQMTETARGGCDSCGGCSSCGSESECGCDGEVGYESGSLRRTCGDSYTGPSCQPYRPMLQRISMFWGIPYEPKNCGNCGLNSCTNCRGGCSSCARADDRNVYRNAHSSSGCTSCGNGETVHESSSSEMYEGSLQPTPEPVPSKKAESIERQAPAAPAAGKTEAKQTSTRRLAPAVRKQASSRLVTEPATR